MRGEVRYLLHGHPITKSEYIKYLKKIIGD
jgi:hypothetical protein